jgi:hypothetical protein
MSNRCDGSTHPNQHVGIVNTKAYCEGRAAAVAGDLLSTNPHQAGSEANAAWAAGWGSHLGGAALAQDCCADPPTAAI